MGVFRKMHILSPLSLSPNFLDQKFWSKWCRTKLCIKFSMFRFEEKFDAEKTRRSKRFTSWIKFLQVMSQGKFPVIDAKYSLKSLRADFYIGLLLHLDASQNLIIIRPFKCFLPKGEDVIQFSLGNVCKQ